MESNSTQMELTKILDCLVEPEEKLNCYKKKIRTCNLVMKDYLTSIMNIRNMCFA